MLTEKDYCDYDTCVALRELGFSSVNNECFQSKIVSKEIPLKFFDTTLQGTSLEYAPIISLYEAQKWMREERHLHIEVRWYSNLLYEYKVKEAAGKTLAVVTAYKTYEEALSEGIKEAVKILKEK